MGVFPWGGERETWRNGSPEKDIRAAGRPRGELEGEEKEALPRRERNQSMRSGEEALGRTEEGGGL